MKKDRLEECFTKIQESISTMNHNSTTTSNAIDKIASAIDKMEVTLATHQGQTFAEHGAILTFLKYVVLPLVVGIVSLVGVKLALPGI